MLGQQRAEQLLKQVLSRSQADATEAMIMAEDSYLTRFANNIIHQNVAEADITVTVRAVVGKRVGTASTNDLSEQGLSAVAARALAHARQQHEDPDFPGLPEPQLVEPVSAFDEGTANFSPEARAKGVGAVCKLAAERGLNAFGAFQTTGSEIAVANSRGVLLYHPYSSADLQTVVAGDDGAGWAQASSVRAHEVNAEMVGREAVEKALRAHHPRAIEPGTYTVVVDSYVTEDLINWLNFGGMSAQAVQEGRSWMNDRIGKAELSPLVTIWDDARDPSGLPMPFDFEGVPRQRVQIVNKGVIYGPVYDRKTAHKEGRESTGHAIPPGMLFASGPLARNLFMANGNSSVDEMIRSTERGLYITRFHYTRLVHPRDCVITGMTRDGLYMIEDGALTYPVKNLRFTQSYVQAMADVQVVGRDLRTLIAPFGGTVRVPALKIARFNFTGITV